MEPVFQTASRDNGIQMMGKGEGEALRRPGRGVPPLGKAIMTLLSVSVSIALWCPSISITSRLPANDRKY